MKTIRLTNTLDEVKEILDLQIIIILSILLYTLGYF